MRPFVGSLQAGADIAAAEADAPLVVLHVAFRDQMQRAVEAEGDLAFARFIIVVHFGVVVVVVQLIHLFLKLAHIVVEVVGIVIDAEAVAAVVVSAVTDKNHDMEGGRILGGQDHQVQERVLCAAAETGEEAEALLQHVVDVDAAENRADVHLAHHVGASLAADLLRAAVIRGNILAVAQVGHAEGHGFAADGEVVTDKAHFHAGVVGVAKVAQTVGGHHFVGHGIDRPRHGNGGEREDVERCAVKVVQIHDLFGLGGGVVALGGKQLAAGGIQREVHGMLRRIDRKAVFVCIDAFAGKNGVGDELGLVELHGNADILGVIHHVADIAVGRAVRILLQVQARDLRRGGQPFGCAKLNERIGGSCRAVHIGEGVQANKARAIALDAIFDHIGGCIQLGQTVIVGVMLELRSIKAETQLAVGHGCGNIFAAVLVDLYAVNQTHLCAGAVDVVLIDAGTQRDFAVVTAAVGIEEGQRHGGNLAQTQVVAGIKLTGGDVALAASEVAGIKGASIGFALVLGHGHHGGGDAGGLIDRQLALIVADKVALISVAVRVYDMGLSLRGKLEDVKLVFQRCCRHGEFLGDAGARVSCADRDRVFGFSLAHQQEVGCGNIGGIAVVADVGVHAALVVVHGDNAAIGGAPVQLVAQHTPGVFAVVGGDDLLQAQVSAQGLEIFEGELVVRAVQVAVHLAVVIQSHGGAADIAADTAGGAADLTGSHVGHDDFQRVAVIHGQQHGIHAPRLAVVVSGIDRDGIRLLQRVGRLGRERNRAVGGGRSLAHRFAGFLDGIFHRSARGGDGVADGGNFVAGHIIAVKRFQRDLCRSGLCDDVRGTGEGGAVGGVCRGDLQRVNARVRQLGAGNSDVGDGAFERAFKAAVPERIAGFCVAVAVGLGSIERCRKGGLAAFGSVARGEVGAEQNVGIRVRQRGADRGIGRNLQEGRFALFAHNRAGVQIKGLLGRAVDGCQRESAAAHRAGEDDVENAGFPFRGRDHGHVGISAGQREIGRLGEGEALTTADLIPQTQLFAVLHANAGGQRVTQRAVDHDFHVVLVIRVLGVLQKNIGIFALGEEAVFHQTVVAFETAGDIRVAFKRHAALEINAPALAESDGRGKFRGGIGCGLLRIAEVGQVFGDIIAGDDVRVHEEIQRVFSEIAGLILGRFEAGDQGHGGVAALGHKERIAGRAAVGGNIGAGDVIIRGGVGIAGDGHGDGGAAVVILHRLAGDPCAVCTDERQHHGHGLVVGIGIGDAVFDVCPVDTAVFDVGNERNALIDAEALLCKGSVQADRHVICVFQPCECGDVDRAGIHRLDSIAEGEFFRFGVRAIQQGAALTVDSQNRVRVGFDVVIQLHGYRHDFAAVISAGRHTDGCYEVVFAGLARGNREGFQ